MSINSKIKFSNSYAKLPEKFFQKISPENVPGPNLVLWNHSQAKSLNLILDPEVDKVLIEQLFSGNQVHESSIPLAMAYAGHQFGRLVPQLGDGRAHLLGEILGNDGIFYDMHLKGSGRTKFSRGGDGKSALGPSIREYIVSGFMNAAGIPTTRALCVIETGEKVYREATLPGGIVARVAPSFVRVGTFEYFAYAGDVDGVKTLFRYCCERLFPEILDNSEDSVVLFLEKVALSQAELIARWMSVGFIHGVMNTDNTAICGVTIDYGPCAFMDEFDFFKVFSSIDGGGRYAFGNQPKIMQWNLIKLAEALSLIVNTDKSNYAEKIQNIMLRFQEQFQSNWQTLMLKKLGMSETNENTIGILDLWLKYLESSKADFTLSHRRLSQILFSKNKDGFVENTEFKLFITEWKNCFQNANLNLAVEKMNSVNPIYIPRNHIIEKVIEAANVGRYDELNEFMKLLEAPFVEVSGAERFARAPTESEKVTETFCGT